MAGIIGGIFGGFARPVTMRTPEAPPAAPSETSATSPQSNLPVASVPPRPVGPTPVPYDLFLDQFTTPSTAAVAGIARAAPDRPSLTELRAHAAYLAVAAEGK